MNDMNEKLLKEIDRIVWDDIHEGDKIIALQRLLYQWGACQDSKTEDWVDEDYPNMRRV